jgi:hypothetical protein
LRIRSGLAWQVVAGEAVLIDLQKGRALGLNETGSFLWPRIESSGETDLARELAAAFAVDDARAREDVAVFLRLLRERGFVED